MRMQKWIVCCVWLLLVVPAKAQQETLTLDLTLQNAVALARSKSILAQSAKNRFNTSYWQYRLFKANYRPILNLDATIPDLNRSIQPITLPDGSDAFVERSLANSSVGLTMSQRLRWTGGQVFVRSDLERIDLLNNIGGTSYLSTPVTVGLQQPLLAHNPFRWENEIEPLLYAEAEQRLLEELEQVSIQAVDRFFDLYLAQINVQIAAKNVANNDTLLNITRGRYNLGKIGENELLQMELTSLNAERDLAQAQLDVQLAAFRLKRFLNLPEDVGIQLLPPNDVPQFTVDLKLALSQARKNRSQTIQNSRQLIEAERDVDRAIKENNFQADLFATVGLTNSATAISNVYTDPQNFQRVRVGVQVPVLDWGRGKAAVEIARSNQQLIENTVEQDLINFEQDVILQVSQYQLQQQQLRIAAKADTVAQKRFEVAKYRYITGKVDITDLNLAIQEKDIARRQNIATIRDYWVNYYNLRLLTLYDFEQNQPLLSDEDE